MAQQANACHGLFVIDKPSGMTSRGALDVSQGCFPRGTAIGHAGTLDPLATGVLVVCVGAATRLTEYVQRMPKVYEARFRLGGHSDSDDADGTIILAEGARPPARALVEMELQCFLGETEQVPPSVSAAKVTGKRAYDLARKGRTFELASRQVRIDRLDIIAYEYPHLDVVIHCGKGTYIRSLARDLGARLGCGAFVETLRRTRVGNFDVRTALSLEVNRDTVRDRLLPLSSALCLPVVTIEKDQVVRFRQGQRLPFAALYLPVEEGEVAVHDLDGNLVAIARLEPARKTLKPVKVLPMRRSDGP